METILSRPSRPSRFSTEAAYDRRWWTLAVLCTSLVIVIVGNTTLNVAIPRLQQALHATNSQLQWIVDAYALVFAGLLFTAGALGDRFGRKGALQIGLFVFAIASGIAAFVDSAGALITLRAVMGVGAALIMPSTLSILTNVFPAHERARAIAIWAGLSGAGAAVGPIASGWLLEHFWWGSVFLVNLPIIGVALVLGQVLVPPSRDPLAERLDPVGAGLSVVGLTSLVYAIIEAPAHGWLSLQTLSVFAAAAVVLGLFAAWELRTRHPMLDLRYFTNPRFSVGSGAISLVFFAMFGMFFLLTQYFQLVLGYKTLEAGVRLLPVALTIMVVAPNSARLAARLGSRATVTTGMILVASGFALISRSGVATGYPYIVLSMMTVAAGMGLTIAPNTANIMSSVPLGKAGIGSAMNDTTREVGGALGVAVLGSVLASRYAAAMASFASSLPAGVGKAATGSLGGALIVAGQSGNSELANAARQAYVSGMHLAVVIGAVVVLTAAALVARFLPDDAPATAEDAPARDVETVHVGMGRTAVEA